MLRPSSIVLAMLAAGTANLALAGSDSGIYVGGSVGSTQVDDDIPDLGEVDFDDEDTGYKVFAGFNLGLIPFLNFAVEGAYIDLGSYEGDNDLSLEPTGWTASGLVGFDMGPIGFFGKLGLFSWDSDAIINADSLDDSGTDPAYGIGAKFQLGPIAVRAEYELFDLDGIDIDYFSVGGAYTF